MESAAAEDRIVPERCEMVAEEQAVQEEDVVLEGSELHDEERVVAEEQVEDQAEDRVGVRTSLDPPDIIDKDA